MPNTAQKKGIKTMANIKKANNSKPADNRETWNIIKGQMRIFIKIFDDGSTSISTSIGRKDNDSWINFYLPVYIAKECKVDLVEGLNTINVKAAFLSAYKKKDGNAALQLVITEAENI